MIVTRHLAALVLTAALATVGAAPVRADAPPPATLDVADGVVQRYLTTPYGELNGLRLADGRVVVFGPLMANSVATAAPVGERIRVIGNKMADGAIRAVAVINLVSGSTADDQPPSPPALPPSPPPARKPLERCEATGPIDLVLHGPRGEANGVILADGSLVYFRPDLVRAPLRPGQLFAAIGIGSRGPQGLAMEAIVAASDLATARAAAATVLNPPSPPQPPAPHVD